MTKTQKTDRPFRAFRPDPKMDKAMLKLQAKTGISFSEQMRRGLVLFLSKQGVYTPEEKR